MIDVPVQYRSNDRSEKSLMASVREIAKSAGVSVTTASRALNSHPDVSPKTRDLVMKAANLAGYGSRRRSANGPIAGSIGLVQIDEASSLWAYDQQLLHGIQRGLHDSKFHLSLISLQHQILEGESYTQFFRRHGFRGVILRTSTKTRQVCETIAKEGFPSLVVAERFDSEDVNYICCDSGRESERAVDHLIYLGHRRIALVVHRRADSDHRDRRRGYEQSLEKHGLEIDPALIVKIVPNLGGGINAINQLMSLPEPPTAVYLTDPATSIGAMCRAAEIGLKVPDDLSLIGFDDATSRKFIYPRMTAVCQSAEEMGEEAARWLCRRIAGLETDPLHKSISAFLEINQTTGIPREQPLRILPNGQRID